MDEYEVKAIQVVRDLLVQHLKEEKWCKARQVGQVLEILVKLRQLELGQSNPGTEQMRGSTEETMYKRER